MGVLGRATTRPFKLVVSAPPLAVGFLRAIAEVIKARRKKERQVDPTRGPPTKKG